MKITEFIKSKSIAMASAFAIIAICLSAGTVVSVAQVINIEDKRFVSGEGGWQGYVDIGFNYRESESEYFALNTSGHIQFKNDKNLYLLLSRADFIRVDDGDVENNFIMHFRYNRKLNSSIAWEAFAQEQFNKVIQLENRVLFGTGPRIKLPESDRLKFYIGFLYMRELEELTGTGELDSYHRSSNYASLTFKPNDQVTLVSTTYYQPNLEDFGDYRIASESNMIVRLTTRLSLSVDLNYNYDSLPPVGVTNSIFSLTNRLRISF